MADPGTPILSRHDLMPPSSVATVLAFAGLPLYIHVPHYYTQEMGVGLSVLGALLLLGRLVDSVQDPLIGRLADQLKTHREPWVMGSGLLLAVGLALLFAPSGWGDPLPRLAGGLLAAFTGFSALQIVLYDHGLAQAEAVGQGYTQIALWREVGGVIGICIAAVAPAALTSAFGQAHAYLYYAVAFLVLAFFSLGCMHGRWMASGRSFPKRSFTRALGTPGIASVLCFGFVNVLPTAVTSTLFLFFVSDILMAQAHAGALLLVFFTSAAMAAPGWVRLADRIGCKRTLIIGMTLSVPVFVWAYALGPGDVITFYAISAASGAALGADMTLIPAILAARIRGGGGQVFSLWTFLQKMALAVAAGTALPVLSLVGYDPGTPQDDGTRALAAAYALVPCALKLVAIPLLLYFVHDSRDSQ